MWCSFCRSSVLPRPADMRRANAEPTVPRLPVELGNTALAHPPGRTPLHLPDKLHVGDALARTDQHMHVVRHAVDRDWRSSQIADNATEICVQLLLDPSPDEGGAFLGGKHDVPVDLMQRLRHRGDLTNIFRRLKFPAPLQGAPCESVRFPGLKPWAVFRVPFRDTRRSIGSPPTYRQLPPPPRLPSPAPSPSPAPAPSPGPAPSPAGTPAPDSHPGLRTSPSLKGTWNTAQGFTPGVPRPTPQHPEGVPEAAACPRPWTIPVHGPATRFFFPTHGSASPIRQWPWPRASRRTTHPDKIGEKPVEIPDFPALSLDSPRKRP